MSLIKKSFQSIGWSKINEYHKDSSQKHRAQIALETLEAIETGSWNIVPYTIEHLHPDSADRKNANIGNLALLEASINKINAAKEFASKVDSYQDSRYKTTRNIYKRYHENPASFRIESRTDAMAQKIYHYIESQERSLLQLL